MAVLITALMLSATVAGAQPSTGPILDEGRLARVDPHASVLILEDGRMYRVRPDTVVYVNNQPVHLDTLRPGSTVVIRSGERVTLTNGQYVAVAPGTAVTVTPGTPVTVTPGAPVAVPPGTQVVVTPGSPPAAVVPAPTVIRQTIYGRVEDVDRDGEVEIKTDKGSFEMRLAPDAARRIKKGDTVMIDATFAPPGVSVTR